MGAGWLPYLIRLFKVARPDNFLSQFTRGDILRDLTLIEDLLYIRCWLIYHSVFDLDEVPT